MSDKKQETSNIILEKVELPEPYQALNGTTFEVLSFKKIEDFNTGGLKRFLKQNKISAQTDMGQMATAQVAWLAKAGQDGLTLDDFDNMKPAQFKAIAAEVPINKVLETFFPSD
ncbi:hypothetical protein [Candidatus Albibeggiatoa sp. nov. NOAA]|uniref:hypothetical protein n=1 Tax=Candidatus Albibeggiatoa sp. nov. NOAA TaxID=3162724 RepID=UPI0032FCB511|nr:hypothetical protein [Thiotrichaceae bacterium]